MLVIVSVHLGYDAPVGIMATLLSNGIGWQMLDTKWDGNGKLGLNHLTSIHLDFKLDICLLHESIVIPLASR